MLKRAETIFFFIAVLVALVLPALPLVQEMRPGQDSPEQVAAVQSDQPVPQQVALAR